MRRPTLALGTAVIGTVFVLLPLALVQLNAACRWPRWDSPLGGVVGGVLMLGGVGVAAYCSHLFLRVGDGTPVPIEPPRRLVVGGLYRYSRNPIYVAEVAILVGLFLHRGELSLLLYAAIIAVALHFWIVYREEPELRSRFGEAYARYMQSVPRWIAIRRLRANR
jgi:protein-S-isoprenylcysteine O-methyltransferase Ste14